MPTRSPICSARVVIDAIDVDWFMLPHSRAELIGMTAKIEVDSAVFA
eukprot:SAG31_NODE_26607_length_439_cov_1.064706_1_plen_46_part_01